MNYVMKQHNDQVDLFTLIMLTLLAVLVHYSVGWPVMFDLVKSVVIDIMYSLHI